MKTTAFDLQLNPVNPGMALHRIDHSKDKNFWSARAGDIRTLVHINDAADWSTMHSHAQFKVRVLLQRAADFQRVFYRLFGVLVKNQRHPIPARNLDQPACGFRAAKKPSVPRTISFSVSSNARCSLIREFGITNDVDKEDVRDFQRDLDPSYGNVRR